MNLILAVAALLEAVAWPKFRRPPKVTMNAIIKANMPTCTRPLLM